VRACLENGKTDLSRLDIPQLRWPFPDIIYNRDRSSRKEESFAASNDSVMSLFGSDSDSLDSNRRDETRKEEPTGLYHFHNMIPLELQTELTLALSTSVFTSSTNQSMLFCSPNTSFAPSFMTPLLDILPQLLLDKLPSEIYDMLFKGTRARQAIFNLYRVGEGITPHIDLVTRFADGIIGCSLLATCVMDFTRQGHSPYSIVLRKGDVYVLSKEARYDWMHGIAARDEDVIDGMTRKRKLRMSITLRTMKEGGDILGV
jgi:hypothetical protein